MQILAMLVWILYSLNHTLKPGGASYIFHGFAMEISNGFTAIVKDKSSISKVECTLWVGFYDAGYQGI